MAKKLVVGITQGDGNGIGYVNSQRAFTGRSGKPSIPVKNLWANIE